MSVLARLKALPTTAPKAPAAPAAPAAPKVFTDRVEDLLERPLTLQISLDAETYYADDYTLSKMTTADYVRDPRFELIGMGVRVNGGEAVWMEEHEFRAWAKGVDWANAAVRAHHAHFDGLILSYHYGVVPGFWTDTLSMARANHGVEVGGSLAKLATYHSVGEKGHEVIQAKGKRRKDFTYEEWLRYGRYCCNDITLMDDIFDAEVAAGFPDFELWLIDTTVRMFTEPTFVLDEDLLARFLVTEKARKAELLNRIAKDRSVLLSNDKFAALLAELGEDAPRKVSAAKVRQRAERLAAGDETAQSMDVTTWALAKSDPGMQALLASDRDEVRWLTEARIGIKSTINETRAERFLKSGANGRPVPVYLKYYGAHTGRWAAGDRMNFQNLERASKKDPNKGSLRKSLLAPDGYALVVADSAQIEARKLAWLAGQNDLTKAFALNRDVYSEFASVIYRRHIDRKANKADEGPGLVGKVGVLGLGFSLGWLKFALTTLKGAMGGDPIQFKLSDLDAMGVDLQKFKYDRKKMERIAEAPSNLPFEDLVIHCAAANEIVARYRKTNSAIVRFWDRMNEALYAMVDEVDMVFGPGGCLRTVRHGIILPTGMMLKYPGLREDEDGFSYMGGHMGKVRVRTYGGAITENVVQALARITVAEQLLRVRARYPEAKVVTMTHDEGVFAVPEALAPEVYAFTLETMKTAPAWAAGLPLSAEGGYGKSYGKIK